MALQQFADGGIRYKSSDGSITAEVDFPNESVMCGPPELVDKFLAYRAAELEAHGGDKEWFGPVSDGGVRRLIELAYHTSLAREEDRYPRFRMICTDVGAKSLWRAATFDDPIEIKGVETLRRLAPAASDTDSALLVAEGDGKLHCAGSVIIGDFGFGRKVGRPEIASVGTSPSLIVRVDAPGCIRVSEGASTFLLDAGRIRLVSDFRFLRKIPELWSGIAAQMLDLIANDFGERSRKYFGGEWGLAGLIHKAWASTISTAINRHHGGAFVILPGGGDPKKFDIKCKYPARMPFGQSIREFWGTCVVHAQCSKGDEHERTKAEHHWNWRRELVFAKAAILAGFSCVDGCVVLDRNLDVVGFGGEIGIDDAMLESIDRKLCHTESGELMEEEVKKLGTRHRSAYRLAKKHPGIVVFVVSQDGDLRIFWSDEQNVHGFEGLHAWVQDHEQR